MRTKIFHKMKYYLNVIKIPSHSYILYRLIILSMLYQFMLWNYIMCAKGFNQGQTLFAIDKIEFYVWNKFSVIGLLFMILKWLFGSHLLSRVSNFVFWGGNIKPAICYYVLSDFAVPNLIYILMSKIFNPAYKTDNSPPS